MYLIRKFITEENQETRIVVGYTYDLEIAATAIQLNYGEPLSVDLITGGKVLYYKENTTKIAFWIKEIKPIQKGDKF